MHLGMTAVLQKSHEDSNEAPLVLFLEQASTGTGFTIFRYHHKQTIRTSKGRVQRALMYQGSHGEGLGCAGAIAALWPLAEGTFVSQLLAVLPDDQLPLLAHLYHLLLSALPALAPASASHSDKEEQRFVNALVHTCLIPTTYT